MGLYKDVPPIYDIIQWDGSNQQEIVDILSSAWGSVVSATNDNGTLNVSFGWVFFSFPPGYYLMKSRTWGTLTTPNVDIIDPTTFAYKYEEVVE